MVSMQQMIESFERFAPKHLAEDWDPVGLQVGSLQGKVSRVLTTLDVTEEVIQEAIDQQCECILAHHPMLFKPLKKIDLSTKTGRMIQLCIQHNITVYAAHTNLDITEGGVNDLLSERLQLLHTKPMTVTSKTQLYKLVVFVPEGQADDVRTALAAAGAGQLGEYEACSYEMQGIGRFTPTDKANPTIGQQGVPEQVSELRLEVIVPQPLVKKSIQALLKVHPYEEPAYDVIALEQYTNERGLGRVGKLDASLTLGQFAEKVKAAFNVPFVRTVGQWDKMIETVAVLGGSGSKYVFAAKQAGADVFITGDMDFHTAQLCEELGLAVIDPGHHVEKVMIEGVAHEMNQRCLAEGLSVTFIPSTIDTEMFQVK